jgi:hypothetical protein
MKILTLIMGLSIFMSSVFAGTIDPQTPDSKYLEYGTKFHHVVKLCCFDGKGLSCGSAVVISPNWIITAAHVVENCQTWSVTIKDKEYKLSKIIIHPNYNTNVFGESDIALGYSQEIIEIDYYPPLYEKQNEVGRICCMAGWGLTGDFNTGTKTSDGKIRAGSNFIDRTEKKVLVCSASRRNEKFTELEYLICSGDSGGGLFIDGKLAGINSSVLGYDGKPNSTYGDESCHTRISLYIDWLNQTMEECSEEKK